MPNKVEVPFVGTTTPTHPEVDDLWVDTAEVPSVMKRYTGSAWELVGGAPSEGGGGDGVGVVDGGNASSVPVSEVDGGGAAA